MKKETHPTYYKDATVHCACGNTFVLGSTKQSIETEVCPKCHPFYTGQERLVDTMGRIEKFQKKMASKTAPKAKKERKKNLKK